MANAIALGATVEVSPVLLQDRKGHLKNRDGMCSYVNAQPFAGPTPKCNTSGEIRDKRTGI